MDPTKIIPHRQSINNISHLKESIQIVVPASALIKLVWESSNISQKSKGWPYSPVIYSDVCVCILELFHFSTAVLLLIAAGPDKLPWACTHPFKKQLELHIPSSKCLLPDKNELYYEAPTCLLFALLDLPASFLALEKPCKCSPFCKWTTASINTSLDYDATVYVAQLLFIQTVITQIVPSCTMYVTSDAPPTQNVF